MPADIARARWRGVGRSFPSLATSALLALAALASSADTAPVGAATLTWDGGGATTNWSEAANWSTNVVPGAGDLARFDGTSAKDATVNVNISVGGVEIDATYGGVIAQAAGRTMTLGTAGFAQRGGSVTGSDAGITINGPLTLDGGSFASTSGLLSVSGAITITGGSFDHAGGTLRMTGAAAAIDVPGPLALWNVMLAQNNGAAKTIAAGDTLSVDGLLTLTNGSLEGGTLAARGDISAAAGFDGGLGTLRLDGAGNQLFSGTASINAGQLPPLVIDKPSGTLTLAGTLRTVRDWTYLAGAIDPGSSTVVFAGSPTISGSHALANVDVRGGGAKTIAAGDTLTVLGTLNLVDGDLNTGVVEAHGDLTQAAGFDGETATLRIAGSGDQLFSGSATPTAGDLPHVVIDKPSGILSLAGTLRLSAGWTYLAGALDPGSSTVVFDTDSLVTGSHALAAVTLTGGAAKTIAAGDTLSVDGLLTLTNGSLEGGTLAARGDISAAAGFDGGLGTLRLDGAGNQLFSGTASINAGQLPPLVIDKPSGTLTLAGTLRTVRDWTYLAGAIDPGSSTVVFAGSPTISMVAVPLFAVEVRSGAPVLGSALSLLDSLNISGGTLDAAGHDIVVGQSLVTAGTLDARGSSVMVAGDVLVSGTYRAAGGGLTLTGSAAQTVVTAGSALHDVTVANVVGVFLGDSLTVGGTLSLGGPLTIGPHELTIAEPIGGDPTQLAGGPNASLTIDGTSPGIGVPASVAELLRLTVSNPAGAMLGAPLTVSSLVLAGGNVDAAAHRLIVTPGGTVTRTAGHVVGTLQLPVSAGGPAELLFDVGDTSTYAPLSVAWASVTSSGWLAATSAAGDAPAVGGSSLDPAASVNRHWIIDAAGAAEDVVTLTAQFAGNDLDPGADPQFLIAAWQDGAAWSHPTVVSRTSLGVEVTDLVLRSGTLALGMPASDLAITVGDAPDPAMVGKVVTYRVLIANRGPLGSGQVRATIELPEADLVSVVADDGACETLSASVECLFPGLGPAAQVEIIIGLTFPAAGVYELDAGLTVSGSSDSNLANNRATQATTISQPAAGDGSLPDTSQIWSESRGVVLLFMLLGACAAWAIARFSRRGAPPSA